MDSLRNQHGESIEEWLASLRRTLEADAVSLCQVVGGAADFNPPLDKLYGIVCRALFEVLNAGGVPAEGRPAKDGWQPIARYQGTVQEMADYMVNHWIAGRRPPSLDDPWLVLPKNM